MESRVPMRSAQIRRRPAALAAAAACSLIAVLAPAAALAAPTPLPYGQNDFGGFRNILPPGQGQNANAVEIAAFLGTGARPANDNDQLDMYEDLVYNTPGLRQADLRDFYKDATFGVKQGDIVREYSPRDDVTIRRDEFGVPHIYGEGRAGAMFGAGYITAEDRLFFIDVLRNTGRAQLSSFVGGSEGNRAMDRSVWADTPYMNDGEFQQQFDLADEFYGQDGIQSQEDVTNYVAGINNFIAKARVNPLLMPGEYALTNHPTGPEDFEVTDVISIASLVAGIFGKGGGSEVASALVLEKARERFGRKAGKRVWADFRRAEDPEAPTTVKRKRFKYPPSRGQRGLALPDRGTTKPANVVATSSVARTQASSGDLAGIGDALLELGRTPGASNALLVSARESKSGRPLAVFGPQVSYFTPQILIEEYIHAPGGPTGPPIDARGSSFPGTNLYVQLGHGRDYAWSATSAGQDIVDTFAVRLCDPDGGAGGINATGYRFRGECLPFDVLERTNSWTPSAADMTPPGSETLRALRTKLGIVTHRARIKGKPYAFTKLRATYFHEVDSALGFADFNNPRKMESAREFMTAANRIDLTFNWLYIDDRKIAYFNSGINQVRAKRTNPDFPILGKRKFEWRNWDPETNTAQQGPKAGHPQVIDQRFLTSWNNKQARGFNAADSEFSYGPIFRSTRLDQRVKSRIRGAKKTTLPKLVDAMEDAGTVDLRGQEVLPWVLRLIGTGPRPQGTSGQGLRVLRKWMRNGSHRRDKDANGVYDEAQAVRIMDAWWPRLVKKQFRPALGKELYDQLQTVIGLHDAPGPVGSAFISGWYGYVQKDLRTLLGAKVRGKFSREYCGGGNLKRCRKTLLSSLNQALKHTSDADLYPGGACDGGDAQWCNDAVEHRALGAITQPEIHWIDRPTFQQVVEIRGHR